MGKPKPVCMGPTRCPRNSCSQSPHPKGTLSLPTQNAINHRPGTCSRSVLRTLSDHARRRIQLRRSRRLRPMLALQATTKEAKTKQRRSKANHARVASGYAASRAAAVSNSATKVRVLGVPSGRCSMQTLPLLSRVPSACLAETRADALTAE